MALKDLDLGMGHSWCWRWRRQVTQTEEKVEKICVSVKCGGQKFPRDPKRESDMTLAYHDEQRAS